MPQFEMSEFYFPASRATMKRESWINHIFIKLYT